MKAQFQQQWDQCRSIISDNVDREAYNAFFGCVEAVSYKDHLLTLQLPSHYVYENLEGQYFDLLRKTLIRVYGEQIHLSYEVSIAPNANMNVQTQPRPEVKQEPEFNSYLNPQFTFATFCEGKSNELALSAALTVAQKPGHTAFNPYFIFGASGVGKTHLAQAIGLRILELYPEKRVLYVTSHLFQVQYTDAVRRNLVNDFINFYQSIDVLIIDDIQEFAGKTKVSTQNTFFHIFNHLHQRGCQLIMTSDRPPVELEDLVPRLLTRFKWGFTGAIEHPDYELRRCILESKCRKEGLNIEPSVIDYIAHKADDNVRDLEGIINSLLAHSIVRNRPIDQELAAQVMRMIIKMEKRAITVEAIINAVLADFGVDEKALHSTSRKREIVLARQAAMYLCKKHTTQSVSRIGTIIGKRDHATVLHAIKNVENLLTTDAEFKAKFDAVEAQLAEY
jgi:chromosomal replication initiator protein